MDLSFFLILDSFLLILGTIILSYFFFKDIFKEIKEKKKVIEKYQKR